MAGEGSEGPSSTPTPSLLHFTKQILLGGKSDSHKSPNSFPESVTHTALVLVPGHSRWHLQRGEVVEHWRGSWGGTHRAAWCSHRKPDNFLPCLPSTMLSHPWGACFPSCVSVSWLSCADVYPSLQKEEKEDKIWARRRSKF